MSVRRPLDVIQVANPCPADWAKMSGDEARRFCKHCGKHVHNLSSMRAEEAERLVCERAGELCVRFARDPQSGRVLTLDYAPAPQTSRRRMLLTLCSIGLSVCTAGAWTAVRLFRKPQPVRTPMVVGSLLPPPRVPPPSQGN